VVARLAAKDITLGLTPAVYDYLAKEGYSPHYGARPLRRLIQDKILTKLASLMVARGVLSGGSVTVDMRPSPTVPGGQEFHFDVRKTGRARRSPLRDLSAVS